MKLKDLFAKIVKGESLSDDEKKKLEGVDPDALNASLDAEKERAAQLEKELEAERKKAKEAEDKIKAAEAEKLKSLPEVDQLKAQIAERDQQIANLNSQLNTVTGERDTAKNEHAALLRKNRISELAAKNGFESPEYLDYLANTAKIDINDDTKASAWIAGLKKNEPKFFRAEVKPGAGSGNPPAGGGDPKPEITPHTGRKVDEIMASLKDAPRIESNQA